MALDYDGRPGRPFKRELKDVIGRLKDSIPLDPPAQEDSEEDKIFTEIARAYIKGNKLKEALGNTNRAGFIPVEDYSDVKFAIQRIDDTQKGDIITFGLFKEACEYISGKAQNINEQFLLNFEIIDPIRLNKTVTEQFKDQSVSSTDWITQFLTALSPFAGAMIAGYMVDMAHSNSPKIPVPDGSNAGSQPQAYHAQGLSIGIATLIELGLGAAGFIELFGDNNKLDAKTSDLFQTLSSSSSARRAVLEDAGYDYESLKKNQKYDDYTAIKNYCISYISKQTANLNYDHWLAWQNVSENQQLVQGAMAMAPMYSKKWRTYYDNSDTSSIASSSSSNDPAESIDELIETTIQRASAGLKEYFSTLFSISNDHYDRTFLVYSMELDARFMCCILWFLGPLQVPSLEGISRLLRFLSLDVKIDPNNMLAFVTNSAANGVLNLMVTYANRLIDDMFNSIMSKIFKVTDADFEAFAKYCISVKVMFNLINKAFQELISYINDMVKELKYSLSLNIDKRSKAFISVSAERRYLRTLSSLIDAIVDKIEVAQKSCNIDSDLEDDPQKINDLAAEAAVEFVSTEVSNLYPLIDMPEDVRRKFFRNISGFSTDRLELPIAGTDELGQQLDLVTEEETVSSCGEGSRAVEGIKVGKKIADIMEGRL